MRGLLNEIVASLSKRPKEGARRPA
jgi:hypothetical protein